MSRVPSQATAHFSILKSTLKILAAHSEDRKTDIGVCGKSKKSFEQHPKPRQVFGWSLALNLVRQQPSNFNYYNLNAGKANAFFPYFGTNFSPFFGKDYVLTVKYTLER